MKVYIVSEWFSSAISYEYDHHSLKSAFFTIEDAQKAINKLAVELVEKSGGKVVDSGYDFKVVDNDDGSYMFDAEEMEVR